MGRRSECNECYITSDTNSTGLIRELEAQQQHVPIGELLDQEEINWQVCGQKFPRSELVFFSQAIIIYVVVILSLFNLTTGRGDPTLWSSLLSGSLGYLLPSPSISKR